MLHKSVRLWQVCHTVDLTKFLFRQSIAILTLWSLSQLGLLELSCSCCWNVGRYEFSQTSFWAVSFTRTLPNTSIRRSRTLEGVFKEPIIQIPRNILVPCTVQFIGLFGFVWLLYKFVSSAILASSCSVKKKICLQNCWEVQTFKIFSGNFIYSLNLKTVFKHYVPPHYRFIFWRMLFFIFQMYCLHYRMPVMCLELQKFSHFSCLPHRLERGHYL